MAYKTILKSLKGTYPKNATKRYQTLDGFERVLNGTLYERLRYEFHQEVENGKYIPLIERAPSVPYNLARIVVDNCSSLTFGEAHFPHIRCQEFGSPKKAKFKKPEGVGETDKTEKPDDKYRQTEIVLGKIVEACDLVSIMMDSIYQGSIGSCAITVRGLPDGEYGAAIDVFNGKTVKPVLDLRNPRVLRGLARTYRTSPEDLGVFGYKGLDPDKKYWMHIELDAREERWYQPLPEDKYERLGEKDQDGHVIKWIDDPENTKSHGWGIVPAVWIRNLRYGDGIDGPCTFEPIIDMQVENDYLLSQVGRGFKYAMDPLLVKQQGELESLNFNDGDGTPGNNIVKSPARVLESPPGGDYKLLEITGNGLKEAREHIKMLREYALEVIGGMKSDQAHSGANQSGRALELLHQTLVWLVERLRISHGTNGLVPLLRILLHGVKKGIVHLPDTKRSGILSDAPIRLVWPSWWVPRGSDLRDQMAAMQLAAGGSEKAPVPILPRSTITHLTAGVLDLTDPNAELEELQEQDPSLGDELVASQVAQAKAQTQVTLNPPAPKPASTAGK